MVKWFSSWWNQTLGWQRVNSTVPAFSSAFFNLIWNTLSKALCFILCAVYLPCHCSGFWFPIKVFCCSCYCFQLMWSRFPPAIGCCLSSSGIRLIISMCSHSFYRYTQGSGHLLREITLKGLVPCHTNVCTHWLAWLPKTQPYSTSVLCWWAEKPQKRIILVSVRWTMANTCDWPAVKNWLWCVFIQVENFSCIVCVTVWCSLLSYCDDLWFQQKCLLKKN